MTTTTEAAATARPPTAQYHWIITVQYLDHESGSLTVDTMDGVVGFPAGMSRKVALNDVLAAARRSIGLPADQQLAVLFFSLEPDEL